PTWQQVGAFFGQKSCCARLWAGSRHLRRNRRSSRQSSSQIVCRLMSACMGRRLYTQASRTIVQASSRRLRRSWPQPSRDVLAQCPSPACDNKSMQAPMPDKPDTADDRWLACSEFLAGWVARHEAEWAQLRAEGLLDDVAANPVTVPPESEDPDFESALRLYRSRV